MRLRHIEVVDYVGDVGDAVCVSASLPAARLIYQLLLLGAALVFARGCSFLLNYFHFGDKIGLLCLRDP